MNNYDITLQIESSVLTVSTILYQLENDVRKYCGDYFFNENLTFFSVKEAGGTSEIEILIGILTAVTLLLFFLFIVVLAYSRRQKLLNSPTSRSPFPVQINMKVRDRS